MLEWLKRHAWKACIPQKRISGSNPDLSANNQYNTIMKKVLFALILAGGIFTLSSCAKDCTCTAKFNGEVISETTVSLGEGEKCSDYDGYIKILAQSYEQKCTPNLF